jgi:hypothetical protein
MTAKQKAAREKFKKVVAEAGKLRKKNPSLTQGQAVKQAWEISYSKNGETKKVGAVKKDSSASFYKQQKEFEKQKKVNDAINKKFVDWEYPVPPVYTGNWTIKDWSNYITKNGNKIESIKKTAKKIGYKHDRLMDVWKATPLVKKYQKEGYKRQDAIKQANFDIAKSKLGSIKKSATKKKSETKVVAKKRKTNKQHTDTKSHNVNIKVVSGIGKIGSEMINELKVAHEKLIKWQKVLSALDIEKAKVSKGMKPVVAMDIKRVKDAIKEQKIHIQQLKKNIK